MEIITEILKEDLKNKNIRSYKQFKKELAKIAVKDIIQSLVIIFISWVVVCAILIIF